MQNMPTTFQANSNDNLSWPKDFHELKLMDDAFKCGICYDYIKTSMITPCGHSYCSICIRKSLLYKSACPICFEETFETSLRNNRVLDRLAELFAMIKDELIRHLRIAAIHFNCNKTQLEQVKASVQSTPKNPTITAVPDATPTRNTGTALQPIKTAKGKLSFPSNVGVSNKFDISKQLEEILGSPATSKSDSSTNTLDGPVPGNIQTNENESRIPTVPSMFLQPKQEPCPQALVMPTVPCPVCNVHIPERNINTHLDNCLTNVDKPPVSHVNPKHKRKPLAKMVWSLMQEKEIRKKLKDHGLSTHGDKKSLISRIQKFITLYNSECDSEHPKPLSEIIRIVEKEEKKIVQSTQNQQRLVMSKMDPRLIEESNTKYIQENRESFMKLITKMVEREGRNIKPASRLLNRISDDTSDTEDNNLKERCSPERLSNISFPSTSKLIVDHIDLCDSNGPTSPVLDSSFNGFDAAVYEYSNFEPQVVLEEDNKSIHFKQDYDKLNHREDDSMSEEALVLTRPPLHSLTGSPEIMQKSPRSDSPCCIETSAQPSDSEDSISLLINQNIYGGNITDDDVQGTELEEATANVEINSQVNDPDFVIGTEELFIDNGSEQVFIPQRKSKRKLNKLPLPEDVQNVEPRRTRRRLNK